jgi:hypothetical protein
VSRWWNRGTRGLMEDGRTIAEYRAWYREHTRQLRPLAINGKAYRRRTRTR